jgi:predicted nuclease of predicted toxin-antitoxin system
MKIWLDAQLPPTLAQWIRENFDLEAYALRELQLRDAKDLEIFIAARAENAIIMTKDSDFVDLVCRLGSPPQILWLTCGNVTNRNLRKLLTATLLNALKQLNRDEIIVEIGNKF